MEKIEVTLYMIDELSDKAKERAYNIFLSKYDYTWSYDNRKTLEAFCDEFPIRMKDWEYDTTTYYYSFMVTDPEIEVLQGDELVDYIQEYHGRILNKDCPLTGYCMDWDILLPICEYMQNQDDTTTFYDLIDRCFDNFFNACSADMQHYYSEENFYEMARENDWKFYEDGRWFF